MIFFTFILRKKKVTIFSFAKLVFYRQKNRLKEKIFVHRNVMKIKYNFMNKRNIKCKLIESLLL